MVLDERGVNMNSEGLADLVAKVRLLSKALEDCMIIPCNQERLLLA